MYEPETSKHDLAVTIVTGLSIFITVLVVALFNLRADFILYLSMLELFGIPTIMFLILGWMDDKKCK